MPDIAMCLSFKCPKRGNCYRYLAKPSPYVQSYLHDNTQNGEKCDKFLPVKCYKHFRSVGEVDNSLLCKNSTWIEETKE